MTETKSTYVDAEDSVAGRLASIIAKRLLSGDRVTVLNVEKSVITGEKRRIIDDYMKFMQIQSKVNPRRLGPFKPRTPEGIFKRIVLGMLPKQKPKGREAYRRLRVFVGIPEKFKSVDAVKIVEARYRESPYGYLSIEEIARTLGWRPIRERLGEA
ncbi:MAG: 50S ribosomal protein L13 [Candidatus Geothermarchaeales archaeon]